MLEKLNMSNLTSGTSSMMFDKASVLNASDGDLTGFWCDRCRNKGVVYHMNGNDLSSVQCSCMKRRRSLRRIEKSGLKNLMDSYTFDRFQATEDWQIAALEKAQSFIATSTGWFYICGSPGTGKTHLCTAICKELIERENDVVYMVWREQAPQLKASVNDTEAYKTTMEPLKTVDVLYIDDFFKARKSGTSVAITDADVNLAFEILNARYNNPTLRTIISAELSLAQILDIDEALGSRIAERAKGFLIQTQGKNRRMT